MVMDAAWKWKNAVIHNSYLPSRIVSIWYILLLALAVHATETELGNPYNRFPRSSWSCQYPCGYFSVVKRYVRTEHTSNQKNNAKTGQLVPNQRHHFIHSPSSKKTASYQKSTDGKNLALILVLLLWVTPPQPLQLWCYSIIERHFSIDLDIQWMRCYYTYIYVSK